MDFKSIRKSINSKSTSVKELLNDAFLKIDSKDIELNSFITTTKDIAIAQAENIDKLIRNKESYLKCRENEKWQKRKATI